MDRYKQRMLARFQLLAEPVRIYYESKLLIDDLLSIHKGFDKKHLQEWVDVVLINGTRDHWTRQMLSPRWHCNSVKLHKADMKKEALPLLEHEIGRMPKDGLCRFCGAELAKGTFSRSFWRDGFWKFGICLAHGQGKEVIDKVWALKRAPKRVVPPKVGRRQMATFVKRHNAAESGIREGQHVSILKNKFGT